MPGGIYRMVSITSTNLTGDSLKQLKMIPDDSIMDAHREIILNTTVINDSITEGISNSFDYIFSGDLSTSISVPQFPKHFQIGVIFGSSGSGKSVLLKNCFPAHPVVIWDQSKSIASHFKSSDEAAQMFGAVGLNSIPSWLKPEYALSTGEKFRANLARVLGDNVAIDEFTSVVNREVATSCCVAISKHIRRNNLHNIVFASCHDDIIPYLQPDWIYNTDTKELCSGRLLRRPNIELEVVACSWKAWDMFKSHHYLSSDINHASTCYMAIYKNRPVAFLSLMNLSNAHIRGAVREHRVVVLPDYQGMGIGNVFSEKIAGLYVLSGRRYFVKTANPRMGEHRNKSKLWKPTTHNMKVRKDYLNADGSVRETNMFAMSSEKTNIHSGRFCYCHEYIGGSN